MITKFSKYKQEPEITYYDNGQKVEEYYLNGKRHREDGPAIQLWYSNGQKQYETYYLNDKEHREDGPAFQSWHYNGQKQYNFYYLNGKNYTKEEWIEKLKEIGSPHYKEQKFIYDAEKYNL